MRTPTQVSAASFAAMCCMLLAWQPVNWNLYLMPSNAQCTAPPKKAQSESSKLTALQAATAAAAAGGPWALPPRPRRRHARRRWATRTPWERLGRATTSTASWLPMQPLPRRCRWGVHCAAPGCRPMLHTACIACPCQPRSLCVQKECHVTLDLATPLLTGGRTESAAPAAWRLHGANEWHGRFAGGPRRRRHAPRSWRVPGLLQPSGRAGSIPGRIPGAHAICVHYLEIVTQVEARHVVSTAEHLVSNEHLWSHRMLWFTVWLACNRRRCSSS